MPTWQEGQRVRGKNQYAGKFGSIKQADGWVTKPSTSKANAGGLKVHVQWDDEPSEPVDIVDDKNLEKI